MAMPRCHDATMPRSTRESGQNCAWMQNVKERLGLPYVHYWATSTRDTGVSGRDHSEQDRSQGHGRARERSRDNRYWRSAHNGGYERDRGWDHDGRDRPGSTIGVAPGAARELATDIETEPTTGAANEITRRATTDTMAGTPAGIWPRRRRRRQRRQRQSPHRKHLLVSKKVTSNNINKSMDILFY